VWLPTRSIKGALPIVLAAIACLSHAMITGFFYFQMAKPALINRICLDLLADLLKTA
jgi:hypothetical protein